MTKPLLTIGMATHTDFHGTYFTIQSIRTNHPSIVDEIEFVVIDNAPDTKHGEAVKGVIDSVNHSQPKFPAKYIPFKDAVGTSASRERIFKEASGKFVMSVDCHVLFPEGSLETLIEYLKENPDTSDFMHGPLFYDNLVNYSTHFNDQWRSEMWGTWGAAWEAPTGFHFTVVKIDNKPVAVNLDDGFTRVGFNELGFRVDPKGWEGHEAHLVQNGCTPLGGEVTDEPFDIPGQGLGMFLVAKEHWPGFNIYARGFGGEELYVHRKHKENGHRVVLLPFLRWVHRFARPDGVKYPLTLWNKVRNYVLEFQEMKWDLEPVRQHFVVDIGNVSPAQWDYLVEDAINRVAYPHHLGKETAAGPVNGDDSWVHECQTPECIVNHLKGLPRDFEKHMDRLTGYANKCETVLEFSDRRETLIPLLFSTAKKIQSYNTEGGNVVVQKMARLIEREEYDLTKEVEIYTRGNMKELDKIEPADLVLIDKCRTREELDAFMSPLRDAGVLKRFVVLHDVDIYKEFMPYVLEFMKAYPEWSVVEKSKEQHGLLVLSCDDRDKHKLPPLTRQAKNFFTAVTGYVASKRESTPKEAYEERLAVCYECPSRNDKRCGECGCFIEAKAAIKNQQCPIAKWPIIHDEPKEEETNDDNDNN